EGISTVALPFLEEVAECVPAPDRHPGPVFSCGGLSTEWAATALQAFNSLTSSPAPGSAMPAARVEIKASAELKRAMAAHYEEIRRAAGEGRVARCTSAGPAEILCAFGFRVRFPESA
ncbi:MAG: hypothetical protein QW379_08225, partial [Thermoplasmata archaeon]